MRLIRYKPYSLCGIRILFSVFFLFIFIFSSQAPGQYNNSSVVLTSVPFVQPLDDIEAFNSRAFGYSVSQGPVKFFLNNPGSLSLLANQSGQVDVVAGTMTPDGVWWGGTVSLNQLIKIDTTTGNRIVIGTMSLISGFYVTGLAYDITTSTMYLMTTNATTSVLYSVDLATAQLTIKGTSSYCIMDIACSNSGTLYGVDINTDNFGMINKTNGAFTVIGPLGYNAELFQGMSWDRTTDSCWITTFHYNPSQCELKRVNIQTGATTLVGVFLSVIGIDAFAIKSPLPPPAAPALSAPPNNAVNVTLTPALDWSDVPTAVSYGVQVSTSPSFGTTVVSQTGLSSSQYTIPAATLQYNTVYYWRANAVNSSGTGIWSSVWSFTTLISAPAAPILVSPLNGSVGQSLTPILDWQDVPLAQTYRVNVSTDSNFSNTVINQSGLTASQYGIQANTLMNGVKYYWRVNATNTTGTGPWSAVWKFTTGLVGIQNYSSEIPKVYKLYNNYPNPFNPDTKIRFDIPVNGNVKLIVYNSVGQQIAELVNGDLAAGAYEITWSSQTLPSGIYFYKINTSGLNDVKKMILIK